MNSRLRIFSSPKIAVSSNLGSWFEKHINGIRVEPLNKACTTQTKLQLLLKDLGLVQLGLQDIKLQSRVPEVKPQLGLSQIPRLQNSTALNLRSSI
jgi:hypothetical protein